MNAIPPPPPATKADVLTEVVRLSAEVAKLGATVEQHGEFFRKLAEDREAAETRATTAREWAKALGSAAAVLVYDRAAEYAAALVQWAAQTWGG